MKRFIVMLLLMLLVPSAVSAHVVNDQNLYEDLQYSTAKQEIVYLSGLGVIASDHGSSLFSPKEKLTRADLAYWVGAFYRLQPDGASREEVAAAALEKGFLSSLEGNATYEDVNRAYFQGQASVEHPERELSREEFALFVYQHRAEQVAGKTLYAHAGFVSGPAGVVEKVSVREKITYLQVAGVEYPLSAHPRIINASTDPATWQGKSIEESWLREAEGQLHLLVFASAPAAATVNENAAQAPAAGAETAAPQAAHDHGETAAEGEEAAGFPIFPVALGVILVSIVASVWVSKRRTG